MNFRTFTAMLARDARVARRNLAPVLLQNLLLPGIVAVSMLPSGMLFDTGFFRAGLAQFRRVAVG